MKKVILIVAVSLYTAISFGQNVGINTSGATPDASAALDIDYTDKGLLIPRVALTSTTDVVTIPAPATSLLVYNTNAGMTGGAVGFWYWDGTQWVQAIGPQGPIGATGATGPQGPQGPAGTNGTNGTNGVDGISCWDLNGNGVGDLSTEDINSDGVVDILDCQGATGPTGATGPQGPQGPIGLTGATGATGATGPQGPAGADGTTNMNGYNLTTSRTISNTWWTTVTGVSVTFTAQTTSALVNFSASGYGYTNSMAFVQFRVRNGATTLGGTNTKIQSYDDVTGTVTPWSCTFTRYVTGLTIGNSYTFTVQGQVNGIFGTYDALVDPSLDGHHMTLSIIQ